MIAPSGFTLPGLPAMPSLPAIPPLPALAGPGVQMPPGTGVKRRITSGAELTQRVGALVQSVDALLKTNTVQAIVDLAKAAGCQDQINQGVDVLTRAIGEVLAFFQSMKDSLQGVGALGGLLNLLEPLVTGLEGLAATSADNLREAGLEQLNKVVKPAGTAFRSARHVLRAGGETLRAVPSWDDVERLRGDLQRLAKTIAAFKV